MNRYLSLLLATIMFLPATAGAISPGLLEDLKDIMDMSQETSNDSCILFPIVSAFSHAGANTYGEYVGEIAYKGASNSNPGIYFKDVGPAFTLDRAGNVLSKSLHVNVSQTWSEAISGVPDAYVVGAVFNISTGSPHTAPLQWQVETACTGIFKRKWADHSENLPGGSRPERWPIAPVYASEYDQTTDSMAANVHLQQVNENPATSHSWIARTDTIDEDKALTVTLGQTPSEGLSSPTVSKTVPTSAKTTFHANMSRRDLGGHHYLFIKETFSGSDPNLFDITSTLGQAGLDETVYASGSYNVYRYYLGKRAYNDTGFTFDIDTQNTTNTVQVVRYTWDDPHIGRNKGGAGTHFYTVLGRDDKAIAWNVTAQTCLDNPPYEANICLDPGSAVNLPTWTMTGPLGFADAGTGGADGVIALSARNAGAYTLTVSHGTHLSRDITFNIPTDDFTLWLTPSNLGPPPVPDPPERPLIGENGDIFGGSRATLAAHMKVSEDAISYLYGFIIITLLTFAGAGMAGDRARGPGAVMGGTGGIMLSVGMGLWPFWGVVFMGVLGLAAFFLLQRRTGDI